MTTSSRPLVLALLLGVAAAAPICRESLAQEFPTHAIRLYAGVGAGGIVDILGRTVAEPMSKILGQPVIVETKTGAGGLLAFEYVSRQPPDGYNIALGTQSLTTARAFVKDLRFDPVKDLVPLTVMAEGPAVLTAAIGAPYNTFQELVNYGKANPDKVTIGVPGAQSVPALWWYAITQREGIKAIFVPYKGGTAVYAAQYANEVQLGNPDIGRGIEDIKAGKVKGLAVTGLKRSPELPGIPSTQELGHPEVGTFWLSLNVAAGTPKPIFDKLVAAARSALADPAVVAFIRKSNLQPLALGPTESLKKLADEEGEFTEIARKAGIQPQ